MEILRRIAPTGGSLIVGWGVEGGGQCVAIPANSHRILLFGSHLTPGAIGQRRVVPNGSRGLEVGLVNGRCCIGRGIVLGDVVICILHPAANTKIDIDCCVARHKVGTLREVVSHRIIHCQGGGDSHLLFHCTSDIAGCEVAGGDYLWTIAYGNLGSRRDRLAAFVPQLYMHISA